MRKYKLPSLLFILILAAIFFILGFVRILPLRPQSIHQWAQCDRASVALNFSQDTYNIFKPRVHNTANGTGITGMEFPIVNYITGMLYRLFGFHEFLYRILMVLIISTGLIAAFKFALIFLEDYIYAGCAVLLMYLSPVLVYYTPNFLPDTAGLGLILCGWYYFLNYLKRGSLQYLVYVSVCVSLACLIKITYLISAGVMLYILIESIYKNSKEKSTNLNKGIWKGLLAVIIPLLLTTSWYLYAAWLSEINNSSVFLLKYRSITDINHFIAVIKEISDVWLKQYYSKYMYAFILASMICIIAFRNKIDRLLFKLTILLWLGNLTYFIFMMAQFPEHDYYIISMLPALIFQFICMFSLAKYLTPLKPKFLLLPKIIIVVLMIHSIWFSRHILHDRYDENSWMKSEPVNRQYFDISEFVADLGIASSHHVISAYDKSPDITLYLMNVKGVTVSPGADLKAIIKAYRNQTQYIILNDPDLMLHPPLSALKSKFLGTENNIYFYQLLK